MAPPVRGGKTKPGTVATRYWESSLSRAGRGSHAGPWPGPVLRTLWGSGRHCDIGQILRPTQESREKTHLHQQNCIFQWSPWSQHSRKGTTISIYRAFHRQSLRPPRFYPTPHHGDYPRNSLLRDLQVCQRRSQKVRRNRSR